MLEIIDNPKRDPRFTRFNLKIEAYHHALENGNMSEARQLLQEIHYFQQELINLALDSIFDPRSVQGNLKAIFDWSGISEEWSHVTTDKKIPVSLLSTEMLLNELTGIPNAPNIIQQWREEVGPSWVGSVLNAVSFLWATRRSPQIDQYIQNLLMLHDANGFSSLNYFYGLQQVKHQLLHTINFTTLTSSELVQYQNLLNQINGQINEVIRDVPILTSRYVTHGSIALALRQDFQKASQDNKEQISRIFQSADFNKPIDASSDPGMSEESIAEYNEQMAKNKSYIYETLPNMDSMYVRKISSANNKTWLLQNDLLKELIVLRVEQPNPASLIQRLRATPVNEFLSQTFATCLSEYNPYPIVISEFSLVGDLRSNRKEQQESQENSEVLQKAISDIGQMAQFCQTMLAQQAMHSDIKLSNFLLAEENKMFVNDMKAFKAINPEGKILAKGTIVTLPFAPPEYKKSLLTWHVDAGKPIELDADKFMSYQLGLALYDYLVLPSSPDWSEQALNFDYPVFASPTGKKLQSLIKLLTLENPQERASTQYALVQLEKLQSQSAKLHTILLVSGQPPGTGALTPTDLDREEEEHTVKTQELKVANQPIAADSQDDTQHPPII